ncbi:hypothetical protein BOH78_2025 [Pichia kudriavzevii]|uniref:Uncharacterized protein n=1 Tax=Pichia kudriavzevii TaxID=4909 RepID=A0A1V2LP44_PICKU|nr:hypothetical protein BOH78_2025 [Pichia kudriavzevii]
MWDSAMQIPLGGSI